MLDTRMLNSKQTTKHLKDSNTSSLKKWCCDSIQFWKNPSPENVVVQFCRDTSLHGLKYIGQANRHVTERIFWLIAFIGGITLSAYLISDVWYKYKSNPLFVAFAPKEILTSKVPFPAFTICNMNRIQKSVALEIEINASSPVSSIKSKALEELKIMKSICKSNPSMAKMMNAKEFQMNKTKPRRSSSGKNVIDFLFKASQPCHEMIQRCFFGDLEFSCEFEFYPVTTESGLCCTANMMPPSLLLHYPGVYEPHNWVETIGQEFMQYDYNMVKEWAKWDFTNGFLKDGNTIYPYSPETSGKSNSFAFLLFPDLENYYCTSSDSTGFLVAINKPIETPHPVDYGMVIPPGAEVYANIIPELTIADPSISGVPIISRSCYFMHEYPLKYYKAYTDLNCEDECVSNFTILKCGCAMYYQPRDNITRICEENDIPCTTNVSGILRIEIRDICSTCYPLCNELDYRMSSSLSVLQNHSTLWPVNENKNISRATWYGKPVTILNIYFSDRTTIPKVRKKLFESTDLIANVGGLLGLCLGFSGLSAIELIYFCTMRTWFQKKRFRSIILKFVWKFINAVLKKFTSVVIPSTTAANEITLDKNNIPIINTNEERGKYSAAWDSTYNLKIYIENSK